MRDPKRIERIIELLKTYWTAEPDFRLGQIVANLTPVDFNGDPYYVEDNVLEDRLRDALKRITKESK